MSEKYFTKITFRNLGLCEPILQGIEDAGFSHCTPIQAESLPLALAGNDILGQAQTGTGKTAVFLVAALEHLLRHPAPAWRTSNQPRVLILAPTRELAIQIHRDAQLLSKYTGLRLGLAYGGTGYESQRTVLACGVDILIGTPGRIIDYFKQRVFDLKAIQVLVLDEADRMFDLGFIGDVRYLLRRAPRPDRRLGLLFSATLSLRVTELAYEHMNNPQLIRVEPHKVTVDKVRQSLYHIACNEKIPLLLTLLTRMDPSRTLVFVNTKRTAETVHSYLKANGFQASVLSGDVPQVKRQRLLLQFQRGHLPVLVATDVAARGLHIPNVSHVFNFDLPQDPEDYVHRIGRTARLGAEGDAVSFACEAFVYSLPDIEAYIGRKIPVEHIRDERLIAPKSPEKAHRGHAHHGPPEAPRRARRRRG
jgi:Superfamily II DNA and RNA helicases